MLIVSPRMKLTLEFLAQGVKTEEAIRKADDEYVRQQEARVAAMTSDQRAALDELAKDGWRPGPGDGDSLFR